MYLIDIETASDQCLIILKPYLLKLQNNVMFRKVCVMQLSHRTDRRTVL
jgi:hypothetical protein